MVYVRKYLSTVVIDKNPDLASSLAAGGINEITAPLGFGAFPIPLTIDAIERTIPTGKHIQIVTAHAKKFSVVNSGKLVINGSLTYFDLGE